MSAADGPRLARRLGLRLVGSPVAPRGVGRSRPAPRFVALRGTGCHLRSDGRVLAVGRRAVGRALAVRAAAPYASWLQGRPVLHAAGLQRGGDAVALVGESGAGKSTLARQLAGHGFAPLSDDLLACRWRDGRLWVGPADASPAVELAALCFLDRSSGLAAPHWQPATRREAVSLLLAHGWGDLRDRRLWRLQFDCYVDAARACRAYRLWLPDDLDRLSSHAAVAARLLEAA